MKLLKQILFVAILSLGISSLAQATTYIWNFDIPSGSQVSPHTYYDTVSAYYLTAYGYTTVNGPASPSLGQTWGPGSGYTHDTGTISAHNLFGKNSGAGEIGLGLADLPSNEIQYKSFAQLDLTNLYNNSFTSLTMTISSMQATEGYYLWGSNTVGVPGTLLRTATGLPVDDQFQIPSFGTYTYFSVSATPIVSGGSSDILIENGLTAKNDPVPVPPSLLLFGSGLLGLGAWRRLRKS